MGDEIGAALGDFPRDGPAEALADDRRRGAVAVGDMRDPPLETGPDGPPDTSDPRACSAWCS
jgi:hypothetical protein